MASIYILGAGAMGSLWATHLHRAFKMQTNKSQTRNSVHFISTRTPSPKNIKFSLSSPFLQANPEDKSSEFEIKLPVIQPEQLCDASQDQPTIILICTKSYHAHDAVLSLKPYLGNHSYLVLFQNGLGSQHKIIESFEDVPIYAAVSTEGVNRKENGKIVHAGKGLTRIGPLNEEAKEATNFQNCIIALSHQGLDIEATENIWPALWEKLAINCAINPFTAILNCPNGDIIHSDLFKKNWPKLRLELTQMMIKAGFPCLEEELEARVFKVVHDTRTNIASMLQDMRANRKTEIEDINGFAAEYLQAHKINNSVNTMLTLQIRNKEHIASP